MGHEDTVAVRSFAWGFDYYDDCHQNFGRLEATAFALSQRTVDCPKYGLKPAPCRFWVKVHISGFAPSNYALASIPTYTSPVNSIRQLLLSILTAAIQLNARCAAKDVSRMQYDGYQFFTTKLAMSSVYGVGSAAQLMWKKMDNEA